MHLFDLLHVYLIFFFFGYWIYAVAFRRLAISAIWAATLIPVFGLCAIAIYSGNVIGAGVTLATPLRAFIIATLLLDTAGLWIQKSALRAFASQVRCSIQAIRTSPRRAAPYIAAGIFALAIALTIMGPICDLPLTTPWRIGPDAAGYVNNAAFLTHGETIRRTAWHFTSPVEMYSYEFMVQFLRRSCAGVIAVVAILFHRHPAEISFLVCAFCWMLCMLVSFHLALTIAGRKYTALIMLCTGAIALNCNLLFILYEGGYAQIMSMPVIMLIILLTRSPEMGRVPVGVACMLYGMLLAAVSGIYLESIVILVALLTGYGVIELLLYRKWPQSRQLWIAGGSLVVMFALNWDVMIHWLVFEMENGKQLSAAGWNQPQWASLPEIMGWIDIYRHIKSNITAYVNVVPQGQYAESIALNAMIVITVAVALWRRVPAGVIALIPLMMITGMYWYVANVLNIHNYSYMKMYTLVLPLLYIGVMGSLLAMLAPFYARMAVMGFAVLAMVNGYHFVKRYRGDYAFVTPGMLELPGAAARPDMQDLVVLPLPEQGEHAYIRSIFVSALYVEKTIYPSLFTQQNFSASRKFPVALLVPYHGQPLPLGAEKDIIWKGSDYLLLNTHITVESAWKNMGDIHWSPWPGNIPRPEIMTQWTLKNNSDNAASKYDFSPYYAQANKLNLH